MRAAYAEEIRNVCKILIDRHKPRKLIHDGLSRMREEDIKIVLKKWVSVYNLKQLIQDRV